MAPPHFRLSLVRVLRYAAPVAAAIVGAVVVFLLFDTPSVRSGSDGPSGDPGRFMAGVVRLIGENRYGRAWSTLHPEHKRVASRRQYVACEELTAIPATVRSVQVLGVFDEPFQLTRALSVPSKAVAVRITLTDALDPEPYVLRHTVHAVAVGERWAWVLPPERFAAYRDGTC